MNNFEKVENLLERSGIHGISLQKIHEQIWWSEYECDARTVVDYLCGN